MKLLLCLLLFIGISSIKCQDSESSTQESKNQVQPSAVKEDVLPTDVDKEVESDKSPELPEIDDDYDDYSEYEDDWDSLELDSDKPNNEPDANPFIPEANLDDSSEEILSGESFEKTDEKNDDSDMFSEDDDDDDDVNNDDWLQTYNVPELEDESPSDSSAESDETVKSNWSYGKYLQEQEYIKEAKKYAIRRWMFIVAVVGCLLLILLMLVAILRLRKISQARQGSPYYTLKEDA